MILIKNKNHEQKQYKYKLACLNQRTYKFWFYTVRKFDGLDKCPQFKPTTSVSSTYANNKSKTAIPSLTNNRLTIAHSDLQPS